jgi:lysophospholipase L1-like esterase
VAAPVALLGLLPGAAPASASAVAVRPAAMEQSAPLRIMALGDSITWGVGSKGHDGYRSVLLRRLTAAGRNVDFVGSLSNGRGPDREHEGHKGWTIEQLSTRLDEWLAESEPDVILLHIGTNDMVRGIPDAAWRLNGLLDQIAEARPDAEVFVAKIIGLADYADAPSQQVRTAAFNRAVGRIVAGKGDRFHLVDQSRVRGIDMWNREHPNDYGYSQIAWNWYRALEPVLNTGDRAWPATGDPATAAISYRCIAHSTLDPAVRGCHEWHLRRPPGAVTSRVWQLPVQEKVRYSGEVRVVTRWVTAG